MKWTLDEESRARAAEYKREYRKANREHVAAQDRKYKSANKEAIAARKRAHREANKESLSEQKREYQATPRGKFACHKANAKARGVSFLLTFDEWWGLWKHYWHIKCKGLHMCRTGDEGAYELGNVRIDTASNNAKERNGTL